MNVVELDSKHPRWPVWNIANVSDLETRLVDLHEKSKAIFDAAEADDRDMTPAEATEYDSLHAQFKATEEQLKRQQSYDAMNGVFQGTGRKTTSQGPDGGGMGRDSGPGIIVGRGLDGRSVKGYRPGEAIPWNAPRANYDFADWVRAAYSGDWSKIRDVAQTESVGADGGFTVPPVLSAELIELVRNQTRVIEAGARTVPMTSKTLSFAKQESDPVAYFRGELVPIPPSKATFSMVTMTAYTVGAIVPCSEEVLMDSINLGPALQTALAKALAQKVDLVALTGTGVGMPLGVLNTPGVQTTSSVGTLSAIGHRYTDFTAAWGKLLAANFEPTALLFNAKTAALIDDLKDAEDRPLQPPDSWNTYKHLVTNQLPEVSNASTAVLGDFTNLWIGVRQNVKIEFSREGTVAGVNAFESLAVMVRAWMRVDSLVVRPSAFCLIPGITTTP